VAREPAAPGDTITCPDCGRQSPADRLLCECGYPLEFEQRRQPVVEAPLVTRAPGDRDDDDTAELPPVLDDDRPPVVPVATRGAPRPAAADGGLCPSCGEPNPPERTWCARCGHRLRPEPVAAPAQAPAPPQRASRLPVVIAGLVALVLAGVLGTLVWLMRDRQDAPDPQPTATPAATATVDPGAPAAGEPQELAVDRITVVTASSTQTDECSPTCEATNLLDGVPATAWNHDGVDADDTEGVSPAGVTLTFEFSDDVDVVGLRIVNGYVKTVGGESLFTQNHRVAEMDVKGDDGAVIVTLLDTPEPQQVDARIGITKQVTLTIRSTYSAGAVYPDVALSEVRFLVAP
jgi:hypothetical protein